MTSVEIRGDGTDGIQIIYTLLRSSPGLLVVGTCPTLTRENENDADTKSRGVISRDSNSQPAIRFTESAANSIRQCCLTIFRLRGLGRVPSNDDGMLSGDAGPLGLLGAWDVNPAAPVNFQAVRRGAAALAWSCLGCTTF